MKKALPRAAALASVNNRLLGAFVIA